VFGAHIRIEWKHPGMWPVVVSIKDEEATKLEDRIYSDVLAPLVFSSNSLIVVNGFCMR
jgi:hypothetical protein